MYVHDIKVGTTALEGKPEILKETMATALVEGNNLLGPVSVIERGRREVQCTMYHAHCEVYSIPSTEHLHR